MLMDIIADGQDAVLSFLNDTCTDGLERQDEEAGYDDDQTMEEEGHRDDGSGDRMEGEGQDEETGSGDRTESGQVYILIN